LPIIRHATHLGIWTTLITNGHALEPELIKELYDLRVALVISLHSLKPEIYEYDNGCPNSFRKFMEVIEKVSEIFRDESWMENGYEIKRAGIHWTLMRNNLTEVVEAQKFCQDRRLHFSIAPLANVGQALDHPEIQLPGELSGLEEINRLGDESIIFYDEPDGRLVCGTCKYGLNIGADGNLLLDAHGGYEVEIANIRDINLETAVKIQHEFSNKMFEQLSSFCPVRDPSWKSFLENKGYL
jgi:MoaA/NifB/PqqE/SkfB family radical SAM enzyme